MPLDFDRKFRCFKLPNRGTLVEQLLSSLKHGVLESIPLAVKRLLEL
jgi:hypothetical protein